MDDEIKKLAKTFHYTSNRPQPTRQEIDHTVELGKNSELRDFELPIAFSEKLEDKLGLDFVDTCNNLQKGIIEKVAAEKGISPEELAKIMREVAFNPPKLN